MATVTTYSHVDHAPLYLAEQVLFINIGRGGEDLYTWANEKSDIAFTKLDISTWRGMSGVVGQYVRLTDARRRAKVVMRSLANDSSSATTFIVATRAECQFQVIEAILDYLAGKWFDVTRDTPHLSTLAAGKVLSAKFKDVPAEAFAQVPAQYLVMLEVPFAPTREILAVWVKKALVEGTTAPAVTLVFEHAPYHMLLYIERNFNVLEQKIVAFSE